LLFLCFFIFGFSDFISFSRAGKIPTFYIDEEAIDISTFSVLIEPATAALESEEGTPGWRRLSFDCLLVCLCVCLLALLLFVY
jgi:hypothetical protein